MYKALIVDDEKHVRIAIQMLGKWTHFDIMTPFMASNGEEALAIMRKEEVNLVFVDMHMPIMNGTEFLQKASLEFPQAKYIVVSGYDDFQYLRNAMQCGAVDYLLKPVDENELNDTIDRAMKSIAPKKKEDDVREQNLEADKVIHIIHEYIDEHYQENIKISMFAEKYFFSKEHLNRQFKNYYGTSIYEYVLQVRMEHAKILLNNPDLLIQDIATQVGYADTNYFSKAFRSYYNDTPSTFRTKNSI